LILKSLLISPSHHLLHTWCAPYIGHPKLRDGNLQAAVCSYEATQPADCCPVPVNEGWVGRQTEGWVAGGWVNSEKSSDAAVFCISLSNNTLICMLFRLHLFTVTVKMDCRPLMGGSGVFTSNVGRTSYFYRLILFSFLL